MGMATPVEVSQIGCRADGIIEGLGGIWRDRPWFMSERSVITEVEDGSHWVFFVRIEGENVPISIASVHGRKHLVAGSSPLHAGLRAWQNVDERGWPCHPGIAFRSLWPEAECLLMDRRALRPSGKRGSLFLQSPFDQPKPPFDQPKPLSPLPLAEGLLLLAHNPPLLATSPRIASDGHEG
jgi:hypothetical protein